MLATATHLKPVPDLLTKPGDETLERLFQQYHEQVFRAAYRLTGNALDAEDVLQTVFLRLVRRKGELDLGPNPGSYLHRAAINAALDLLRARGTSAPVPLEDAAPELVENPKHSPEAAHAGREVQRALRRALTRLSPNAAEMFALRYFEGYDNHEIAALLGTSKLVVGVILHRTRAKLRKELGAFLERKQL